MPDPDYVRVYDRDLMRVYTAVRSSTVGIDTVEVIEGADPMDEYGNPAGPEFDVAQKPTPEAEPAGAGDSSGGFSSWKVADLKAEVERRNADRDADHITVEEPGNKPELVAALAADDAATATTEKEISNA